MSANTVISDVGRTLELLLVGSGLTVSVSSPQNVIRGTEPSVNLYLYQVSENAFAKNLPPLSIDETQQQRSPLALSLLYMITPYSRDTEATTQSEHLVLGRAMQVLYDNGVVIDPDLFGSLSERNSNVRLSLCRMNLEEQTRIWNALQLPYRLSVCYEARIVLIDSQDTYAANRVLTEVVSYEF